MKPDCLRGFGPVGTNGKPKENATMRADLPELIERIEYAIKNAEQLPRQQFALNLDTLRSLDAALRALRDAPVGWQPIESAPKGQVLLYWPATKPARGHAGQHTLSARIAVDYAGSTPNRPPTHWMPLPEPPEPRP